MRTHRERRPSAARLARRLAVAAALAISAGACSSVVVDAIVDRDAGGGQDTDTGTAADTDSGTGIDTDTDEPADLIVATVTVPPSFADTPRQIQCFFIEEGQLPAYDGGAAYEGFAIGPGEPYEYVSHQGGQVGWRRIGILLLVEGGGEDGAPMVGVDWWGFSSHAHYLGPGTGTIDVGVIPMEIVGL